MAMANAPDAVLRAADYVTDHNDADGVAKAMHQLIMGGIGGLQRARA
ncbi:MAG: HAD hydrolase family protein [Planctomycetota bacterium]